MREERSTAREPWQDGDPDAWKAARGEPRAPECARHRAELRAAVAQHACERREAGASVERVLAEIDGLVQRAERFDASTEELAVLLGQVRLWGLDAYFDEPEMRNAPRFY